MLIVKGGQCYRYLDGKEAPYDSPFIAEKRELSERVDAHSSWKHQDRKGQQPGMVSRSMLWGGNRGKLSIPQITDVVATADGFVLVVAMSQSGGLLRYHAAQDDELRLFHREGFQARGIAVDGDRIVTTAVSESGACNLVSFDDRGKDERRLTDGDSVDEHPFRNGGRILYDSRGIGRTEDGQVGGFSTRGIFALDRETGAITALRESPTYDYALPRCDAKGNIYAIRLPRANAGPSLGRSLRDALAMPVVLIMGIIGFIHAFTTFFAKKPVLTDGGPRHQEDLRKRIILAQVVNIEASSKEAGRKAAAPRSWKLVRLDGDRDVEIASHALGYACVGERILVNDGFRLTWVGGETIYTSDELIEAFSVPPTT